MLSFSTDEISPSERFDHWREVRGKSLFGVTIELDRERRQSFRGRFSAHRLGVATVSTMNASSYRISRTTSDIARIQGNSLCISQQIRGGGWLNLGRGRIERVFDGDYVLGHSDLPYEASPVEMCGFDYSVMKIPVSYDMMLGIDAGDLFLGKVGTRGAASRALVALYRSLIHPESPDEDRSEDIVHLVRLALLERRRVPGGMPEIRAALRTGLRHAAQEILLRDLNHQGLSPSSVARELGISTRQVHVLFEPTGRSFSRTLTAMRLNQAEIMLKSSPGRSVADIAFASGFDSLATFYRAFRNAYGLTPVEMRMPMLA